MTSQQKPVAEGLFSWPSDNPQLIGSRCPSCDEVTFPAQSSCPACSGQDCKEIGLSRRGTLWTWTIQNFPPPHPFIGAPRTFVPFGVGYIELAEGLRVESRLTENDAAQLRIGMEMEMVIEQFGSDDGGNELVTFAFRPTGE